MEDIEPDIEYTANIVKQENLYSRQRCWAWHIVHLKIRVLESFIFQNVELGISYWKYISARKLESFKAVEPGIVYTRYMKVGVQEEFALQRCRAWHIVLKVLVQEPSLRVNSVLWYRAKLSSPVSLVVPRAFSGTTLPLCHLHTPSAWRLALDHQDVLPSAINKLALCRCF